MAASGSITCALYQRRCHTFILSVNYSTIGNTAGTYSKFSNQTCVIIVFLGGSNKTIQVSAIVHVSRGGPSRHRLPRRSGSERAPTVSRHARVAGRADLRPHQANQQERASAEDRSSGIHTKVA